MSESKGFIANNWFKLFFVAVTILVIGIYFSRESKLDDCIENASLNYQKEWEFQCKESKQASHCSLPRIVAEGIEKTRDTRANQCINRYRLFR